MGPGEHEGAKQLLSVTDRKVEESGTLAESDSVDAESRQTVAKSESAKLRWR
jgi:hypothetical protein